MMWNMPEALSITTRKITVVKRRGGGVEGGWKGASAGGGGVGGGMGANGGEWGRRVKL